jgi:hypothetical protein
MADVILQSTLTCPFCGKSSKLTMPEDCCQYYLDCPSCQTTIKAKSGDCCVFCSYGDTPCPSIQHGSCSG